MPQNGMEQRFKERVTFSLRIFDVVLGLRVDGF